MNGHGYGSEATHISFQISSTLYVTGDNDRSGQPVQAENMKTQTSLI